MTLPPLFVVAISLAVSVCAALVLRLVLVGPPHEEGSSSRVSGSESGEALRRLPGESEWDFSCRRAGLVSRDPDVVLPTVYPRPNLPRAVVGTYVGSEGQQSLMIKQCGEYSRNGGEVWGFWTVEDGWLKTTPSRWPGRYAVRQTHEYIVEGDALVAEFVHPSFTRIRADQPTPEREHPAGR